MPNQSNFLSAFCLKENTLFGDYVLTDVKVTEKTLSRYRHYQFDMNLTFQGEGNPNEFYKTLLNKISSVKVIYGKRDPYSCSISKPMLSKSYNGIIKYHLTGNCIKICQGVNCLNKK